MKSSHNRQMDDLQIHVLFNNISVTSRWLEGDNDRLCAMKLNLQLTWLPSPARIKVSNPGLFFTYRAPLWNVCIIIVWLYDIFPPAQSSVILLWRVRRQSQNSRLILQVYNCFNVESKLYIFAYYWKWNDRISQTPKILAQQILWSIDRFVILSKDKHL